MICAEQADPLSLQQLVRSDAAKRVGFLHKNISAPPWLHSVIKARYIPAVQAFVFHCSKFCSGRVVFHCGNCLLHVRSNSHKLYFLLINPKRESSHSSSIAHICDRRGALDCTSAAGMVSVSPDYKSNKSMPGSSFMASGRRPVTTATAVGRILAEFQQF